MDLKKILVLLVVLIVYINYENYIKSDVSKLYTKIAGLQASIKREVEVRKEHYTKESLLLNYDKVAFNGKNFSYSQAMGAMQNKISTAAKDLCDVKSIKWAQVPTSKEWYDKLRLNVSLSCTPKNLFLLTNKLGAEDTIFVVENARFTRDRNSPKLNINMQLVSFRTHK